MGECFRVYYSKSNLISDMPWIAYKMDIKFNEYTKQIKDEKQKVSTLNPFFTLSTLDPEAVWFNNFY